MRPSSFYRSNLMWVAAFTVIPAGGFALGAYHSGVPLPVAVLGGLGCAIGLLAAYVAVAVVLLFRGDK